MRWRPNSPASRLFAQSFVEAQIKENIKAPRHWPLWGEVTYGRWFLLTKGRLRAKCFHLMRWWNVSNTFQNMNRSGHINSVFFASNDKLSIDNISTTRLDSSIWRRIFAWLAWRHISLSTSTTGLHIRTPLLLIYAGIANKVGMNTLWGYTYGMPINRLRGKQIAVILQKTFSTSFHCI